METRVHFRFITHTLPLLATTLLDERQSIGRSWLCVCIGPMKPAHTQTMVGGEEKDVENGRTAREKVSSESGGVYVSPLAAALACIRRS